MPTAYISRIYTTLICVNWLSVTQWLDADTQWLDTDTQWLDAVTQWLDAVTQWLDAVTHKRFVFLRLKGDNIPYSAIT